MVAPRRRERDGRVHRCRLEPGPLEAASELLPGYRELWDSALEQLARYLEEEDDETSSR